MRVYLTYAVCAAAAYLVGAVPFGYLVAKSRGIDIRKAGSGNIGATNVFRALGKGPGILTLVLDALKGFIPVFLFPILAAAWATVPTPQALRLLCACAAVAGHNWPVTLGFRGGKGVATSAGALLAVSPVAVGISLGVWILVVLLTRIVSVSSIAAALSLSVCGWVFHAKGGMLIPVAFSLLAVVGIWRHRANIGRLVRGEENRFDFPKRKDR
ncbi:MAG: glycerol-3-phosphate 1-O-acyltransferase PlsY [Lentisphaerae bacterium]|nr:glycerol-3-phosphate 1-O-acyltransferase PlsY [Lentisphaerota bacterium]